jgi:hypothetical protein
MAKRNVGIGIGIGIGAAGLIGYAAARLIIGARKRRAAKPEAGKKEQFPEEPDAPPKDIACPACGAQVREYEFFCPSCGHPMETEAAARAGKPADTEKAAAKK